MIKGVANQTVGVGMVDATTGGAFSGVVTVYITGDNGTQATGSVSAGVCTAEGNGAYTYRPAATETNYNHIAFTFDGTNAIPRTIQYYTLTEAEAAALAEAAIPNGVTARSLITGALQLIGVIGDGETPTSAQMNDGFRRLNMMMGSWAIQPRTMLITQREVFTMSAGKGSPDDPYTIGPTGDFDTERPVAIYGAATLLTTSTPNVETPLVVYTDNQYGGLPIKGMSNGLASGIWYQPTSPLGKIYFWSIPDIATNELVLYLQKPLVKFAAIGTGYHLPDGAEEAIEANLAMKLAPGYSVQVSSDVRDLAKSSLAIFKRSTYQLIDLPSGFGRRGWYDITRGS